MRSRIPLPAPLDTGPFTTRQGLDAGLGQARLRGPDLHAPFHGIRTPRDDRSVEALCHALQQKLPEHARFCGITAAVVIGVPLPPRHERSRILHVAVSPPHRAPSGRGVHGHTFRADNDALRMWHGLRISSPERLWIELAESLTVPDLVAAGDFLIQWRLPLTTEAALQEAILRLPGRRGMRALRAAHLLLSDRSESPQESRLRVIVVSSGLTGLAVNLPVTTSDGFRYRGDLAFPAHKVIIEYQSELYHRSPEASRADMTRISRLEADGWYVMQLNGGDLDDPAELVRRIRRILALREHLAR